MQYTNHSENFMLAPSHDEVVHGKSNLIAAGRYLAKVSKYGLSLICLLTQARKRCSWVWSLGQWSEWNVWGDLEWHLLQYPPPTDETVYGRSEPSLPPGTSFIPSFWS